MWLCAATAIVVMAEHPEAVQAAAAAAAAAHPLVALPPAVLQATLKKSEYKWCAQCNAVKHRCHKGNVGNDHELVATPVGKWEAYLEQRSKGQIKHHRASSSQAPASSDNWVFNFGKHKGLDFAAIDAIDPGYIATAISQHWHWNRPGLKARPVGQRKDSR